MADNETLLSGSTMFEFSVLYSVDEIFFEILVILERYYSLLIEELLRR